MAPAPELGWSAALDALWQELGAPGEPRRVSRLDRGWSTAIGLMSDARGEATRRMVAQAVELGANAVINVRYSTSSVSQGAAEIYVYGTAVKVAE